MRKLLKLLFVIGIFFTFNIKGIKALDSCVETNSCIEVCSYTNYFTAHSERFEESKISIYFFPSGKHGQYNVAWQNPKRDVSVSTWGITKIEEEKDRKPTIKGPYDFDKAFSNEGRNTKILVSDINEENFRCPKYGYINTALGQMGTNVCFDDDNKSCNNLSKVGKTVETTYGERETGEESAVYGEGRGYLRTTRLVNLYGNLESKLNGWVLDSFSQYDLLKTPDKEVVKKYVSEEADIYLESEAKKQANPSLLLTLENFINSEYYKNKRNNIIDEAISRRNQNLDNACKLGTYTEEQCLEVSKANKEFAEDMKDENLLEYSKFSLREYVLSDSFMHKDQSCTTLFGSVDNPNDVAYWIQMGLDVIKYVAIAALIILSSIEFIKAAAASDNDAIKKATQTSIKRLIFTIVIFFIPILIKTLFTTFDFYQSDDYVCKEVFKD